MRKYLEEFGLGFSFLFVSVSYELPMTPDFSVWYGGNAMFALFFLVAHAAFGCYISLGGRQVFKGRPLRDDMRVGF